MAELKPKKLQTYLHMTDKDNLPKIHDEGLRSHKATGVKGIGPPKGDHGVYHEDAVYVVDDSRLYHGNTRDGSVAVVSARGPEPDLNYKIDKEGIAAGFFPKAVPPLRRALSDASHGGAGPYSFVQPMTPTTKAGARRLLNAHGGKFADDDSAAAHMTQLVDDRYRQYFTGDDDEKLFATARRRSSGADESSALPIGNATSPAARSTAIAIPGRKGAAPRSLRDLDDSPSGSPVEPPAILSAQAQPLAARTAGTMLSPMGPPANAGALPSIPSRTSPEAAPFQSLASAPLKRLANTRAGQDAPVGHSASQSALRAATAERNRSWSIDAPGWPPKLNEGHFDKKL